MLIVRNHNVGDNTIDVEVIVLGDVLATEAQTVIELGLVEWRRKIGLDKR